MPEDAEIAWAPVIELDTGNEAWAPAALCYMWQDWRKDVWGIGDTNGCAAGRTHAEATLHALLELIERDAVSIWWYNALRRPAVNCEDFDDPMIRDVFRALTDEGRDPVMLDLTNDLGIPTYAAIAPRRDGSEPLFGTSAHPFPAVAAHRAAGELSRTCFFTRTMQPTPALVQWLRNGHTAAHDYLVPSGTADPIHLAEPGGPDTMLDLVVGQLRNAGLSAFVLDLTREEIGLPVARALVPGLRHPWRRFAPGRLYTVPVTMGWRDRPLLEHELNPEPCPV